MAALPGIATVGTFLCGQRLAGQMSLPTNRPTLRLRGKAFSIVAVGDATVVQPPRARMHLTGRAFSLNISPAPALASPKLRLRGAAYTVIFSVGPTHATPAVMRLQGKPFTLGIGQSPQLNPAVLRLKGLRLGRVGIPGLIPTVPESIILTPSPSEVGVLTPSPPEAGLLTPSPLRTA